MIKIGDFANLFNVSVKTIRYYENIGLLIPKYVDVYTGYRYYDKDNIYTMQDILTLKNMGFSLEEIKYFSKDSIKNKIANYKQEILDLQSRIKLLQQFSLEERNSDSKMIFVNDEKAIGKWTLLGIANTIDDAKNENFIDDEYNIKELYLLPNGEEYWVISWTKDTIYINEIPNHYEIINDKLYLTVTNRIDPKNSKVAVYNNVNHNSYTLEEIGQKDDINVKFIPDIDIIGTWKTVDCINNMNSFNPNNLHTSKDKLFLEKMTFDKDGKVSINYNTGKVINTNYTKDYIVNLILPNTLSKYTYQDILGKKYIVVEWKSGDYVYGKVINCYYVLEKI